MRHISLAHVSVQKYTAAPPACDAETRKEKLIFPQHSRTARYTVRSVEPTVPGAGVNFGIPVGGRPRGEGY